MRAKEFITESSYKPGKRSDPAHHFERSHPGLVMPGEPGDVYWGRYYDFYRVCSLAGMDPKDIEKIQRKLNSPKMINELEALGLYYEKTTPLVLQDLSDNFLKIRQNVKFE